MGELDDDGSDQAGDVVVPPEFEHADLSSTDVHPLDAMRARHAALGMGGAWFKCPPTIDNGGIPVPPELAAVCEAAMRMPVIHGKPIPLEDLMRGPLDTVDHWRHVAKTALREGHEVADELARECGDLVKQVCKAQEERGAARVENLTQFARHHKFVNDVAEEIAELKKISTGLTAHIKEVHDDYEKELSELREAHEKERGELWDRIIELGGVGPEY